MLIGHLLGKVEPGQRTDLEPLSALKGSEVRATERSWFRDLAEYEERVEEWLTGEKRIVSRSGLLKEIKRLRENAAMASEEEQPEVRAGDFRDVLADIPDGSATLVLTDPPYEQGALPRYGDLGAFAARVLRPGGSLICYTGLFTMPEALVRLSNHLRYWCELALLHNHGGQQLPGKWVIAAHKPVLWFVKGHRLGQEYVSTVLRGTAPDKALHKWAQGVEEVLPLIERLTRPDELVVDPFAGSGSFGRAALGLGRRFIGADLDPESREGRVA